MNRREFIATGLAVGVAATIPTDALGITTARRWLRIIEINKAAAVNLRSLADAAGYAGEQGAKLKFLVSETVYGIDVGDWPEGTFIELELQGDVLASDFVEDPNMKLTR